MQLEDVDLFNPDTWVPGVPHDALRLLRQQAPVHFHLEPAGAGFWVITKHADVVFISKNPALFSSAQGTNIEAYEDQDPTRVQALMLNQDPPLHRKNRRIARQPFTPRKVAAMEPHVREIAKRIVDNVAHKGECDFVRDIAAELPLQVIVEIMGIPDEDRHKIFEWTNRLIGFDDPEFQTSAIDGEHAATEMFVYAHGLAQQRRECPRDDMTTALLNAEVDGEKMNELNFNSFFLLLNVAGNETTRNLTAHGMYNLIQHPDQRDKLLADLSLLPTALEEMLRYTPPVSYFRRTVTQDVELRGQKLKAGDKVAMYYASANRDEEVFEDPDRFDITRSPNPHLSFGIGEHYCIGAHLARLELRVIFEELLRRLPDMELAGPVRRLRSNFIDGIKSMPVRFTPES